MKLPILSIICGVLAVFAAGFLLRSDLKHMAPALADVTLGCVYVVIVVFCGVLTGWK
jgi:hypothetical protein